MPGWQIGESGKRGSKIVARIVLAVVLTDDDGVDVSINTSPQVLSPDTARILLTAGVLALASKLTEAVGLGPPREERAASPRFDWHKWVI